MPVCMEVCTIFKAKKMFPEPHYLPSWIPQNINLVASPSTNPTIFITVPPHAEP